jgi:hypothetical protein
MPREAETKGQTPYTAFWKEELAPASRSNFAVFNIARDFMVVLLEPAAWRENPAEQCARSAMFEDMCIDGVLHCSCMDLIVLAEHIYSS